MKPESINERFQELATQLHNVRMELQDLRSILTRADDQRAVRHLLTDLAWAVENCTVIGLHQIGEALDDDMGTGANSVDVDG